MVGRERFAHPNHHYISNHPTIHPLDFRGEKHKALRTCPLSNSGEIYLQLKDGQATTKSIKKGILNSPKAAVGGGMHENGVVSAVA